jgi:hypothetical protein
MADDPNMALEELRRRIRGGARPLLDGLSNEELVAAHTLIGACCAGSSSARIVGLRAPNGHRKVRRSR